LHRLPLKGVSLFNPAVPFFFECERFRLLVSVPIGKDARDCACPCSWLLRVLPVELKVCRVYIFLIGQLFFARWRNPRLRPLDSPLYFQSRPFAVDTHSLTKVTPCDKFFPIFPSCYHPLKRLCFPISLFKLGESLSCFIGPSTFSSPPFLPRGHTKVPLHGAEAREGLRSIIVTEPLIPPQCFLVSQVLGGKVPSFPWWGSTGLSVSPGGASPGGVVTTFLPSTSSHP